MGSKRDRAAERHRVHLQVRYAVAQDFVIEYAENLSQGGVFVAGAHNLEPLSEVTLEISLPGAGTFQVTAEVAHVLTAEAAARVSRRPGAGLAIRRGPKGFREALESYLVRLGRRTEYLVWCGDSACARALAGAGYQVEPAPPPEDLAGAYVRTERSVLAVVVPRARQLVYQQASAAAGGGTDLIVVMDSVDELDTVIAALDQQL